jgi:hypothetical protein
VGGMGGVQPSSSVSICWGTVLTIVGTNKKDLCLYFTSS